MPCQGNQPHDHPVLKAEFSRRQTVSLRSRLLILIFMQLILRPSVNSSLSSAASDNITRVYICSGYFLPVAHSNVHPKKYSLVRLSSCCFIYIVLSCSLFWLKWPKFCLTEYITVGNNRTDGGRYHVNYWSVFVSWLFCIDFDACHCSFGCELLGTSVVLHGWVRQKWRRLNYY